MQRRDFLRSMLAGAVVVAMPVLAGAAIEHAAAIPMVDPNQHIIDALKLYDKLLRNLRNRSLELRAVCLMNLFGKTLSLKDQHRSPNLCGSLALADDTQTQPCCAVFFKGFHPAADK